MTTTPPPTAKIEPTWSDVLKLPLGALGAIIGAALGAVVVNWAAQSGYYVLPAVGLLAGWGAAVFSRQGGWTVGAIAGVVALAFGVFAEWKFVHHFPEDPSFAYFLRHFLELKPFLLLLHAVNVAAAVYCGARK